MAHEPAHERPSLEARVVENLTEMREERGWSQSEVARRMVGAGWPKYTQMTVSRTEKGERPLRLDELKALASIFETRLDMLWETGPRRDFEEALDALMKYRSQLKTLAEKYTEAEMNLALVMSEGQAPEDVDTAAQFLIQTPEAIFKEERERQCSRDRSWEPKWVIDMGGEAGREAYERFKATPPDDRDLYQLLRELHGEHPEAS